MKTGNLKTGRGVWWLAALALPVAVAVSEATAWWWMNPPSSKDPIEVLSYRFPEGRPGYHARPLNPGITEILKCDGSQSGLIAGGRVGVVEVNYFEWDQTDEKGLVEAFRHSPEECMGAVGFEVEAMLPSRRFRVGGEEMVFDVTRFRDRKGGAIHVFKSPWVEGIAGRNLLREGPGGETAREFKFLAVSKRWKPRFARVVMGGVTGISEEEDAWRMFQKTVLEDLEMQLRRPRG